MTPTDRGATLLTQALSRSTAAFPGARPATMTPGAFLLLK